MAGLFGVLDTASRAMGVVQGGVRTTGHNIANVNTPGYSRQSQLVQAARPVAAATGTIGTGVEQIAIERITDRFIQTQLMQENATGGAVETQAEALRAIEEVLNEQQSDGIGAALSSFYSSLSDLASATAPGAASERQGVLSAAQGLADSLHRADERLREQQAIADQRVVGLLSEINSLTAQIAELNAAIVRQETLAPANDLRDRRELLLRELARKAEVQSFEEQNGAVVVLLSGGPTLVERDQAHRLVGAPDLSNPFDPTFTRVMYAGSAALRDVTADIGGGELGGLLRVRDMLAPAAIRSLDVLAYNLSESVNGVHAAGFGLDGSTGNDFFVPFAAVEDAARNFSIDPSVLGNPDAIAAGALGPDPGDNGNALALVALRDAPIALALPGDPPGPPSGPTRTLLEHVASMIADVGLEARSLQDAADQHERILEVLENRREEVSGVSLDEEVTNLVRLQAAFQANARVVSVVDRLLQDVIGML